MQGCSPLGLASCPRPHDVRSFRKISGFPQSEHKSSDYDRKQECGFSSLPLSKEPRSTHLSVRSRTDPSHRGFQPGGEEEPQLRTSSDPPSQTLKAQNSSVSLVPIPESSTSLGYKFCKAKNPTPVANFFFLCLFTYFLFTYLFIYLLIFGHTGSLLLRGLFSTCSAQASHCGCFFCCRARALGTGASVVVAPGLWNTGSIVVAQGFNSFKACGIFPDQGSNLCPCIGRQILHH